MRPLVVGTLLTYLELDGYLEAGTPFYGRYEFKPLASSAEILRRFEGERRSFWRRCSARREGQDMVSHRPGARRPRRRRRRASAWCGRWTTWPSRDCWRSRSAACGNRFRRLKSPPNVDALATTLHRRTLDREAREIARLNQVVELVGHDGCQVSRLGDHFGEPLAQPCGHCSWCLNGQPVRKPGAAARRRLTRNCGSKRWH